MPAGRMLKKALRQLDEGVTRLAVLSLRSFIWPVFVSIAVGSGAWMAFHQKRLGLHSQNKVPQPERMEAFWWTIAACSADRQSGKVGSATTASWSWRR